MPSPPRESHRPSAGATPDVPWARCRACEEKDAPPGPSVAPAGAALRGRGEVVAFLDGRLDGSDVVELAAALAHEHGARLTGVFIRPEPALFRHESFVRGVAAEEWLARQDALHLQVETDRRRLVEGVAARHGIGADWRVIPRFTTQDAVVQAGCGDLAVVGRSSAADGPGDNCGLLDALILASGRPILVLPPRWPASRFRRVVVAWNARREAARAVVDALPLLRDAEAVALLAVDAAAATAGGRAEPGADLAEQLASQGIKVELRRLTSTVGNEGRLILAQAAAFQADLVVMGAYSRSRVVDQEFGSPTGTILREAGLPVMMSH